MVHASDVFDSDDLAAISGWVEGDGYDDYDGARRNACENLAKAWKKMPKNACRNATMWRGFHHELDSSAMGYILRGGGMTTDFYGYCASWTADRNVAVGFAADDKRFEDTPEAGILLKMPASDVRKRCVFDFSALRNLAWEGMDHPIFNGNPHRWLSYMTQEDEVLLKDDGDVKAKWIEAIYFKYDRRNRLSDHEGAVKANQALVFAGGLKVTEKKPVLHMRNGRPVKVADGF